MIETEKFPQDFLESVLHKKCKIELNNGDVLETSSLCGFDKSGEKIKALLLDTGTVALHIPLLGIKSISLSHTSQSASSLDVASF